MSPRKSVDQELTRDGIMDVARTLFAVSGYQHVSMRKIAQEINYSHGALYYHFKNKAEIFFAIISKDFKELDILLLKCLELDVPNNEKIEAVLLGFIQFGLENPHHYELMFMTRDSEVQSHLAKEPSESYMLFANTLSQLSNGEIALQEIWCIFLSIHGFVSTYCLNQQSYKDVEQLAKAHVTFLLRGICI